MDPEELAKLLAGGSSAPRWLDLGTRYVLTDSQGNITKEVAKDPRVSAGYAPGSVTEQDMLNYEKSKFNQQHGLARHQTAMDEAQQNWQQAVSARDFQAAEFWRNRNYELERADRSQRAFEYMGNLRSGPQDWVKYWYQSRGELQPAGEQAVKIEDALPPWAKFSGYGQGAPTNPQWAAQQQPAPQQAAPAPTWAGGDLGSGSAGGRQIVGGSPAAGTPLTQFSDDQIRLASGLNAQAAEEFKRRAVAPGSTL